MMMDQTSVVCPSPNIQLQSNSCTEEDEEEKIHTTPKLESNPARCFVTEEQTSCVTRESTVQPSCDIFIKVEPVSRSCSPTSEPPSAESSPCSSPTTKINTKTSQHKPQPNTRLRAKLKATQSPSAKDNTSSLSSSSIDANASFSYAEMEDSFAEFGEVLKKSPGPKRKPMQKTYQCPQPGCPYKFDRPYRLAQHILAHNNIRPYACDVPNCTKAYTSKSHLDRHKLKHMPQEKDNVVYSCPQCMNTFVNRQNLKRHMNTVHTSEFICENCSMHFKTKNQLTTHMYQHTGIKEFQCDLCSDTFISLYLMKRHLRYHKMYTCKQCNIDFNHWNKFQDHKKTVHEKYDGTESQYTCDDCGRTFKQRTHILRHIKIHSYKRRAFICPYEECARSYSRKNNLKQHILIKHLNLYHVCPICSAQLSTKAKLNHHVELHYKAGLVVNKPVDKLEHPIRKKRKDHGSLKTSTALKLAGLSTPPDCDEAPTTSPMNLSFTSECIEVEVDVSF